jgi:hypothetical protein
MKTDEQMRKYVMRRVYRMYYTRMLAKPATRVGVVGVLGATLFNSISISSVFANAVAVGGFTELATFVSVAFIGTTLVVQAVTVALLGMAGWFAFDTVKKIELYVAPKSETALAQ